jgi:hypothetical protein
METDFSQTFNAPVGNVFNADTLNIQADIGLLSALTSRLPERAVLAPTMIDRTAQCNAIIDRLLEVDTSRGGGALLVTLNGCGGDLHQALVLRCARIDFAESFRDSGPWLYLKRLEWPEGATSVDALVRTVRDAAGLPRSFTRAETEAAFSKIENHICFSHVVDSESWAMDRGALVRQWIDYVASGRLRPARGRLLVAFLCIQLDEKDGRLQAGMRAFLDALSRDAASDANANVLITQPLGLIRRSHVEEWVGTASRYLADDLIEASLIGLSGRLFEPGSDQRRLAVIFAGVQEALARAIGPRARFVETRT